MNWLTSLFRRSVAANTSARRAVSRDPIHAASQPIEQLESRELLAVFSVNSNVADGAAGSLRAAVQNANANQADDTIYLTPGRYVLTLDNSVAETTVGDRGDLDVTESGKTLVLQGSGTDSTILDAAGLDRVLEAHPGSTLVLRDLTLTGGTTSEAGGGLFADDGRVLLDNVVIDGNRAEIGGGGVAVKASHVTVIGSQVERNSVEDDGGRNVVGGGLLANESQVTIFDSSLGDNTVRGATGRDGRDGDTWATDTQGYPSRIANSGEPGQDGRTALGGGVRQVGGSLAIHDSAIQGNALVGGNGGNGGPGTRGIYGDSTSDGDGGDGGSAFGAGISNVSGKLLLTDTHVIENRAIAGDGGGSVGRNGADGGSGGKTEGAGIHITAGSATASASDIQNNSAVAGNASSGSSGTWYIDDTGYEWASEGGRGGDGGSVHGTGVFADSSPTALIRSMLGSNVGRSGLAGGGGSGGSYRRQNDRYLDWPDGAPWYNAPNGQSGQTSSITGGGAYSVNGPLALFSTNVVGDVVASNLVRTSTPVQLSVSGKVVLAIAGPDWVLNSESGSELFRSAATAITRLEIIGANDGNTLVLDLPANAVLPIGGIVFHGSTVAPSNALELHGAAEWIATSYKDSASGSVDLDGNLIEFDHVSTLTDRVNAVIRRIRFPDTDDSLELTDGSAADGMNQLIWNHSTVIDFANPSFLLSISAGAGRDTLTATSVDAELKAMVVIDGETGDDQLVSKLASSVRFLGDEGNDSIRAGTAGDTLVPRPRNNLPLDLECGLLDFCGAGDAPVRWAEPSYGLRLCRFAGVG
ncbi:MAG: hypothetical protein NT013_12835, partial [Planctomycetia bacterium]|nr:hypothetical protein [Planctomycetia bacterium]